MQPETPSPLRVAIIGTVGVPARYGGFETLAENLLSGHADRQDIRYTVYCSAKAYPGRPATYKGARLRYIGLHANGLQSIPYDVVSMFNALAGHDVLLVLGVSGCLCLPLVRAFGPSRRIVVNIDGLEHRRQKWGRLARAFLRLSEKMAVRFADRVVSDNRAIADYVRETYGKESSLIEYGGDHVRPVADDGTLASYGLLRRGYCFKVARIEPENNIALILEAFSRVPERKLVLIGNWEASPFGRNLRRQYAPYPNLLLLDPMYEPERINLLRSNCGLYVHGHSAGGTNPSLVEAMALGLPVAAYDVSYNRATTQACALYFNSAETLETLLRNLSGKGLEELSGKLKAIAERRYRWRIICDKYAALYRP